MLIKIYLQCTGMAVAPPPQKKMIIFTPSPLCAHVWLSIMLTSWSAQQRNLPSSNAVDAVRVCVEKLQFVLSTVHTRVGPLR